MNKKLNRTKKIVKERMVTGYKICNLYGKKGLEVSDCEVNTPQCFMSFNSPCSFGSQSETVYIRTSYCGICNDVGIECIPYLVDTKNNSEVVDMVEKINSVIDVGEFIIELDKIRKGFWITYNIKVIDVSKNIDLLNDVLTGYLNNCEKYFPLLLEQCKSNKSPETIWNDFVKSSDDYTDKVE